MVLRLNLAELRTLEQVDPDSCRADNGSTSRGAAAQDGARGGPCTDPGAELTVPLRQLGTPPQGLAAAVLAAGDRRCEEPADAPAGALPGARAATRQAAAWTPIHETLHGRGRATVGGGGRGPWDAIAGRDAQADEAGGGGVRGRAIRAAGAALEQAFVQPAQAAAVPPAAGELPQDAAALGRDRRALPATSGEAAGVRAGGNGALGGPRQETRRVPHKRAGRGDAIPV